MVEDTLFNFNVYSKCSTMRVVDTCAYRYTVSDSQLTKDRTKSTMRDSVKGYLTMFSHMEEFTNHTPEFEGVVKKIIGNQLFPCISRTLCADYNKAEFNDLKSQMVKMNILPVSGSSIKAKALDLITLNYLSFYLSGLIYSHLFVPFVLPYLRRN